MKTLFKDFVPKPDEDFDAWQKNFMSITTANATAWGIATAEVTALTTTQTAWISAFAAGGKGQKTTRTSAQTKTKTTTRKTYEKALRNFVKKWITGNNIITDAQRLTLRVTIPDIIHSRVNVPSSVPNVSIQSVKGNTLKFIFRQQADAAGKSHRGKPANVHGMKIYYKSGDPAPATPDDCNKSVTATRSPYNITFSPDDTGKKIYSFCCWVNNREEEGPFTQLNTAVVPA